MFGQTFDIHDVAIIGLLVVLEGVLSIDNALVLGLLAKRLPKHEQGHALTYGLIGAFVLAKIISGLTIATALYGIKAGLAVWAGFVLPVQWTDQMFGRRPFKLLVINTGYQLACYLVMGAILGRWA